MRADERPGAGRRRPALHQPTYLVLAPLAVWLQEEARRAFERYGRYRLLDAGCGLKPYYPFFEPYVSEYVGLDTPANPAAEVHGTIEEMPLPDQSFDVVICTQVLEHADDPAQAVRELYRVTRPGGRVLASTHGVQVYHPGPDDYWRWTHTGLERLFRQNGEWAAVTVRAACGTTSTLGLLLALYLDLLAKRLRLGPVGRALVAAVNRVAPAIDRRFAILSTPGPGTIHANYHVLAER